MKNINVKINIHRKRYCNFKINVGIKMNVTAFSDYSFF